MSYDEFLDLCSPLAKSDTEKFIREKNKPVPTGRTEGNLSNIPTKESNLNGRAWSKCS